MQSKIKLEKQEQLDDLLIEDRKIVQNKNYYMFTSDAVLLSNFVKTKSADNVCELCSGSGIIGILIALTKPCKKITMIELQKQLFNMCNKSIKLNNLENKIEVINNKLQGINKTIGEEKFEVVVCNPPYEKNILKLENESQNIARSEKEVKLGEICSEANKLLKYGGKFFCCLPSTRLFELNIELSKNNLSIKDVQIDFDKNHKARLVLVMAKKGAKSDCVITKFYK